MTRFWNSGLRTSSLSTACGVKVSSGVTDTYVKRNRDGSCEVMIAAMEWMVQQLGA